jgi:DNA-binding NarL/FixJ family response regulator
MIAAMAGAVLVVDDDASFRSLARRMLTAAGLSVAGEADTVAAALDAAAALRPDAALIDIGLPDGDGVTLAAALGAMPWHPRILLTSIDPDAASLIGNRGAGPFVPKNELPNAPLRELLADD